MWWASRVFRVTGMASLATVVIVPFFVFLISAEAAGAREFGKRGSGAGEFEEVRGLATSAANGMLYAADRNNARIDAFDAESGSFALTWGWGVADQKPELEKCSTACFAGLSGSGAGAFQLSSNGPRGVAVDDSGLFEILPDASYGDVYVGDEGNARFEKFSSAGSFIYAVGKEVNTTAVAQREAQETAKEPVTVTAQEEDLCTGVPSSECGSGTAGTGEGAFSFGGQGSPPIAVGPTGTVYVADQGRVQEFSESGAEIANLELPGEAGDSVVSIAVNAAGAIYVVAEDVAGVAKYVETTPGALTLTQTLDASGRPIGITRGPEGHVFVEDDPEPEPGKFVHHIYEYDEAGLETAAFDRRLEGVSETEGIAWSESDAELYIGGKNAIRTVTPPPPGPLGLEQLATPEPHGSAVFGGMVNPEGATTEVAIEYEEDPKAKPGVYIRSASITIPGEVSGQPNFADEQVEPIKVSGLQAETIYHYRLVASNGNGNTKLAVGSFETLPAARIDAESATAVTGDSATLQAEVNPLDTKTTYRFEYRSAGAATYTALPAGVLAAADEEVPVSRHISGLAQGAAYEYRIVVENELASGAAAIVGQTRTLVTQRSGASLTLPDGRQWELVSPIHKQGAGFEAITPEGGLSQASTSGDALAYIATSSIEGAVAGEPAPDTIEVVGRHTSAGWSSRDIASPHSQEWGVAPGFLGEFPFFASDLTAALVEPQGETLLGGATERTPYLRRESECEGQPLPEDCYLPLLTAANVTSKEKWGGNEGEVVNRLVRVVAATPELNRVLIEARMPLTTEPEGFKGSALYEWSADQLRLVSTAPEQPGEPPTAVECAKVENVIERHVLSVSGNRSIWVGGCIGRHIYMHDTATDGTVQLDIPEGGGPSGAGGAVFEDASADGGTVFFEDAEQLTSQSRAGSGGPDLYAYEGGAEGGPAVSRLTDVTVPANSTESADVVGTIPGAAEDGHIVYVVARGVLTTAPNSDGETATSGEENLYSIERKLEGGSVTWAPIFIATLSPADNPDWVLPTAQVGLAGMTSRVSPNGEWLAFMSERPLTGYDNRDIASGARDEEVYLYNARAHRLECASCEPSGARPEGQQIGEGDHKPLVDNDEIWPGRWVSALVPPWQTTEKNAGVYQSRYLTNGGRVFFDSVSPLVPQAVNHKMDVYEYEPAAGPGEPASDDCNVKAETYSTAAEGCITLLSSGTSSAEAAFLDASEEGDDVFFVAAGKLTPGTEGNGYNVYDAHVCGNGWTCAPQGEELTTNCESATSCKEGNSGTQALTGPPPISASFEGAGDLASKGAAVRGVRSGRAKCEARARRLKRESGRRQKLGRCRKSHPRTTARHARAQKRRPKKQ
jgi:hypothetical protein